MQSALFRSTTYAIVQGDLPLPPGATKALVFVWKNDGPGFPYVDDIKLMQLASDPNAPAPEIVPSAPVGTPVVQLPWGGEVSGQFTAGTSNVLRRYENGLQVGSATVPCGNTFCTATVLRGGGYAAVWIENVGTPDVPSYQLYAQAYTTAGQPVVSPAVVALTRIVSAFSNNPAAVPQLAPLAGGGYVVVWAFLQDTPGAFGDRGVYTQRCDASGNAAGAAQQATAEGAGFLDVIGTTTGGYVVSWGKTGTVSGARAYGPDGTPLAPEQAADVSWNVGAGPRGAMAPLAGGGAAIVGQVLDGPVAVQHISASGVALPAQVASSLGSPGRALVTIAGLPVGGSVVAWTEIFGGNVYARRYAADGTPVGQQIRINQFTTARTGTQILVFADGRFAISWESSTLTRYSRTFPANGLRRAGCAFGSAMAAPT